MSSDVRESNPVIRVEVEHASKKIVKIRDAVFQALFLTALDPL